MQAYLSVAALESHHFKAQVRQLLNLQSRLRAASVLGLWFWQSDVGKFGAGVSPFFQGCSISVFCERASQIDFSDISAILPFDRITVRHRTTECNPRTWQKLVDHIASDLAFDGIKTKVAFEFFSKLFAFEHYVAGLWARAKPPSDARYSSSFVVSQACRKVSIARALSVAAAALAPADLVVAAVPLAMLVG
jgi:hypothetical protein